MFRHARPRAPARAIGLLAIAAVAGAQTTSEDRFVAPDDAINEEGAAAVSQNGDTAFVPLVPRMNQYMKLLPTDGSTYNLFGESVAMSGNIALVGAVGCDSYCGAAYLFDVRTGQQLLKLLPLDPTPYACFGCSVAISGNIAIIGAHDDDNGIDSGSAYLFDLTTGQQLLELHPLDAAAHDFFATSVDISGRVAIVGARANDDNGMNSGAAYLFDVSTGQQLFKLLPNDGAAGDEFGWSVAISGNLAIVGAVHDDDHGASSGAAYVFDVTTGEQVYKIAPFDGREGDRFGNSVAIWGNTALVGAYCNCENGPSSGSAYVVDLTTGQLVQKLNPADGSTQDWFGFSVALARNIAIIGAHQSADDGSWSGAAYLFDIASGEELFKIMPTDGAPQHLFGKSVAISGSSAIISASWDDDNGPRSGSAYLFDLSKMYCTADVNGDGSVDLLDFNIIGMHYAEGPYAIPENGDLTFDGWINLTDYNIFGVQYGTTCP